MRTYSHALLTFAARRLVPEGAAPAALGATLPDVPVAAGGAWLWARRGLFSRDQLQKEACAKRRFAAPDAALHSAVPVTLALTLCAGLANARGKNLPRWLPALLLGWAGHVATDALTHAGDARPLLWPISGRRFAGPVSYWDAGRGGRTFTALEHATDLAASVYLVARFTARGSP